MKILNNNHGEKIVFGYRIGERCREQTEEETIKGVGKSSELN